MKKIIVFITTLVFSAAANAAIYDTARVVSVTPSFEYVSRQKCEYVTQQSYQQQAPVAQPQQRGIGGAIVGGITGGIIGNQVGRGQGKTAATAIGAGVGAIVGDRMENSQQYQPAPQYTQPAPQQVCSTFQDRVTNGYEVTYQYNGKTDSIRLQHHPGQTIPVTITPGN